MPKSICQQRFTATRAVSGFSRMVIQRASPSRSGVASARCGRQERRSGTRHLLGRLRIVAAMQDKGVARPGRDIHHHRRLRLRAARQPLGKICEPGAGALRRRRVGGKPVRDLLLLSRGGAVA